MRIYTQGAAPAATECFHAAPRRREREYLRTISLTSHSAAETKKIGRILAKFLKAGDVVTLQGGLGAGKTTLVKGIAKGLGVPSENAVSSPTFVLVHEYHGRKRIFHLDWYRLKTLSDTDADLAEECFSSDAVTLVEWPERGKEIIPAGSLRIRLSHRGLLSRLLRFSFPRGMGPAVSKALKKI